jgi:hypothetical protein
MTDDTTDTEDTFTTESSPGEQAFEKTVDDAVAFVEAAIDAEETWYGARMMQILRGCVRTALADDGSAPPEQVAHDLSDQAGRDADVEPVLRRLAAMIDESGAAAGTGGGRHG